jgi:hypothetical protein
LELLTIGRSECAIVDGTTNRQRKISAAPRPSHLLRFIHSPVHQEVSRPFGDRGADAQFGAAAVQSLWTAAQHRLPMEDSHDRRMALLSKLFWS